MNVNLNSRMPSPSAIDPTSNVTSRRAAQREQASGLPQDNGNLGNIVASAAALTNASADQIEALKIRIQGGSYQVDAQQLAARILDVHL